MSCFKFVPLEEALPKGGRKTKGRKINKSKKTAETNPLEREDVFREYYRQIVRDPEFQTLSLFDKVTFLIRLDRRFAVAIHELIDTLLVPYRAA